MSWVSDDWLAIVILVSVLLFAYALERRGPR
jgi:hypothetical protein